MGDSDSHHSASEAPCNSGDVAPHVDGARGSQGSAGRPKPLPPRPPHALDAPLDEMHENLKHLLEVDSPEANLAHRGQNKGVDIYAPKKNTEKKFACRVGQLEIPVAARRVFDLWVPEDFPTFDHLNTAEAILLKRFDKIPEKKTDPLHRLCIHYVRSIPKFGTGARDFVTAARSWPKDDCIMVDTMSTDQFEAPPRKGTVRGDIRAVLRIKPTGPSSCLLTYAIKFSPNGWIPMRVVQLACDDAVILLALFRDYALSLQAPGSS
mmetsp:Transcript_20748/g.44968  ORF Transcript_20748/g.44968 Transcript_20748/m.44968 type:complete len:265 (+) Transcript_20748:3-797(+)